MSADSFLQDAPAPRPWSQSDSPAGLQPVEYFLGRGLNGLEVAVAHAARRPTRTAVRALWRARHGGKASPLLLVVLWEDGGEARAWLCGPVGEEPPVYEDLDASQAERIAQSALSESDRHGAIRLLKSTLPETESDLPGLHNAGMFATYHLRERVPQRPDWETMGARGKTMLSRSGRELVEALGFEIEPRGPTTSVLRIRENGRASAVAVFLDDNESPETLSGRFRDATPVTTALARATAENLRYVVLTRGREIRLYGTEPDVGVGRKGRSETYVEANLALLPEERAAYLPLIFGAEALRPNGTFEQILEHSRDFAADIGERLRDRVYDNVVPALALALGRAQLANAPDEPLDAHLDEIYEAAMTVLFRLLFVAYAEDKGLLPYEKNEAYRQHSLKMLARSMAAAANRGELRYDPGATTYWHRAEELWHAVNKGSRAWGLPPYNGGLFSEDPAVSYVGARIADVELPDELFGPALFELLVEQTDEGVYGPVDFAALSVREFGTIYEGLLESSLAVAKEDLTHDRNNRYVPAENGDATVRSGEVFLQGNDGARKATGSYFTPHFAVEHLLEHALVPALDRHLDRVQKLVDAGKEGAAAREFFNFRLADISMGSGHFLVAAVDRIEAGMSDFLERHPLPGVVEELERLRAVALENLGPWGEGETIERASLLRRQIARRCIYGVDVNQVAVQLAQVSLWIHTFVEGLPLSFLNRSLVHGDSLFGAANAEEAERLLSPDQEGHQNDLFAGVAREAVEKVRPDLEKAARSSDATEAQIRGARAAYDQVRERLAPLREALDIAVASTVDLELRTKWSDNVDRLLHNEAFRHKLLKIGGSALLEPRSIHFPLEFPEVFYRDQRGFDCVIGNPPWDKAMQKYDLFWQRYLPGLLSVSQAEKQRRIEALKAERPDLQERLNERVEAVRRIGAYMNTDRFPGMGESHADLYKAFAWRFLNVTARERGAVGVVVPRTLFQAAGSAEFRENILDGSWDLRLTSLVNRRRWVFPDVHPQYSVTLACLHLRRDGKGTLAMGGPFESRRAFDAANEPSVMVAARVRAWNPSMVIPVLPSTRSSSVLEILMRHPDIGADDRPDFEVRPVQGDFNSTSDRVDRDPDNGVILISDERPAGAVPVLGGDAFDLWTFDSESFYGWADPTAADAALLARRQNQANNARSAFHGLTPAEAADPRTLPSKEPRVAFRKVSRATDSRTMRVGAVPEGRYLNDGAQYLYFRRGDVQAQAYVLGVLGSRPLDWAARRYVEVNFSFYLFNHLPVPLRQKESPLCGRVGEIAGRLSCTVAPLETWAVRLGRSIDPLPAAVRADLEAELDAVVSHLYGLEEDDVAHIMETFHEGWDHERHLQRTLEHYRAWAGRLGPAAATS